jgi:hypothetical protein
MRRPHAVAATFNTTQARLLSAFVEGHSIRLMISYQEEK